MDRFVGSKVDVSFLFRNLYDCRLWECQGVNGSLFTISGQNRIIKFCQKQYHRLIVVNFVGLLQQAINHRKLLFQQKKWLHEW